MIYGISSFFFWGGVISGNINPPGGLPETRPGFLETQISAKSQGLKTFRLIFFGFLSSRGRYINHRHSVFEAFSNKIVPELIDWRSEEIIDFFWTPQY